MCECTFIQCAINTWLGINAKSEQKFLTRMLEKINNSIGIGIGNGNTHMGCAEQENGDNERKSINSKWLHSPANENVNE